MRSGHPLWTVAALVWVRVVWALGRAVLALCDVLMAVERVRLRLRIWWWRAVLWVADALDAVAVAAVWWVEGHPLLSAAWWTLVGILGAVVLAMLGAP